MAVLIVLPESPCAITSSALIGATAGVRSYLPQADRVLVSPSPHAFRSGRWQESQPGPWFDREQTSGSGNARRSPTGSLPDALAAEGVRAIIFLGGREAAAACQWASDSFGVEIPAVHVPLCAGNSLPHTHHSCGYGSLARSLTTYLAGEDLDNASFFNGVKIVVLESDPQGWLASCAGLVAHLAPSSSLDAHEAFLAATPGSWSGFPSFGEAVRHARNLTGRATVVVADGLAETLLPQHRPGAETTSRAGRLGSLLASQLVTSGEVGLLDLRVRAQVYSPLRFAHLGRPVAHDQNEALWLASEAVRMATAGARGQSIVLDTHDSRNHRTPRLVPARLLASGMRRMPASMSNLFFPAESFLRYALPLADLARSTADVSFSGAAGTGAMWNANGELSSDSHRRSHLDGSSAEVQ